MTADPRPTRRDFWRDRRVFVTGGHGFVGQHLVRLLTAVGANVRAPTHAELDLERADSAADVIVSERPNVIIHLAARFGGLGLVGMLPDIGPRNDAINRAVMDATNRCRPEHVLVAGSACAYPFAAPMPLREDVHLDGEPHPSVCDFALTKRALVRWCRAQEDRRTPRISCGILSTVYGPGDYFDDPTRAHVIGALLGRFMRAQAAGAPSVAVWGSGLPVRDCVHVEDAVDGLLFLVERGVHFPVNLTEGVGRTIGEIAAECTRAVGFHGDVVFDASKPDGQQLKVSDPALAADVGWRARVALPQGLASTVGWLRRRAS